MNPMKPNINAPLLHGLPVTPLVPKVAGGSLRSALLQELSRDGINGRGGQPARVEAHNAAKKAPHFTERRERPVDVEKGEGYE